MPRFRAVLAVLLAVTWCSAVWHVNLEALGLMFDHNHHEHEGHEAHHVPGMGDDHHDPVFARDVSADGQLRLRTTGVFWISLVKILALAGSNPWRASGEREPIPIRGRDSPPLHNIWQFVWRCAPDSAAPPAVR